METEKIRNIIDYKGYGNFFELTQTRTGEHTQITRDQAEDYVSTSPDFGNISDTYISAKADVALRSVPQQEIFPGTISELNKITVIA
jgi:hypothetical protein